VTGRGLFSDRHSPLYRQLLPQRAKPMHILVIVSSRNFLREPW
jgi:hypothetical protein